MLDPKKSRFICHYGGKYMRSYHLYLDESGKFDKQNDGKHALIGGFLCKSEIGSIPVTEEIAYRWRTEIIQKLVQEKLQTHETIRRGRDYKAVTDKIKKIEKKREQGCTSKTEDKEYVILQEVRDNYLKMGLYVLDHCTENSEMISRDRLNNTTNTLKTIRYVLNEFYNNIASQEDGKIVIFQAPRYKFAIDINTTYLTVLTVGLMNLYLKLKKENNNQNIKLYVHAASRSSLLTKEEEETTPLKDFDENGNPTRVLSPRPYQTQIENFSYLNGGYSLLQIPEFQEMIQSIEIIQDSFAYEKIDSIPVVIQKPNPLTIVCDYICNRYLRFLEYGDAEWTTFFNNVKQEKRLVVIHTTSDNKQFRAANFSLEVIKKDHDWGNGFVAMISRNRNLPSKLVNEYFEALNADRNYDQIRIVKTVVDYLYSFVNNRENMNEWSKLIKRIIQVSKGDERFSPQAGILLRTNMLLYLDALYTHLGRKNDAEQCRKQFLIELSQVVDTEESIALLLKFANREIITCVDSFDYERGALYFQIIKDYYSDLQEKEKFIWEYIIENFTGETSDLSLLNRIHNRRSQLTEYGKSLGSYAQLLCHALRASRDVEQVSRIRNEAQQIIREMPLCFSKQSDLSRCYQNISDLYREMGDYIKALYALAQACAYLTKQNNEVDSIQIAIDHVLGYCGSIGEKDSFVFLHYVEIMNSAIQSEDNTEALFGEDLLKPLICSIETKLDNLQITSPYPQSIIFWRLASSICFSNHCIKLHKKAKAIFDKAYSALKGQEAINRQAMAISIRSEELYQIHKQIIDCPEQNMKEMQTELIKRYKSLCQKTEGLNPFAKIINNEDNPFSSQEELLKVAKRIAY